MAIIAITSAIAVPLGIDYVRNYEVMGAAQGVAAQMQMSRAQAVRRNSRRGILLNFDYPGTSQYQFTTLDANPMTGNWDKKYYPDNPGTFNPGDRNYGIVPNPPFNTDSPGDGLPSPHGEVITLPTLMVFVPASTFTSTGDTFSSLLFRMDGSVEAVDAAGVNGQAVGVAANNLDWAVRVRNPENNLVRVIRISRNGRVEVDVPNP
jgi:Tfp pilus assembly protein FimT